MSFRDNFKERLQEVRSVDKAIATSTDLSLREYVDFLQACQMAEDEPKAIVGKAIRTYVVTTEARLNSKKS